MLCLSCHEPSRGHVCRTCLADIVRAPERLLPGGVRLVAGFEHTGTAKRLVHLLKYQGLTGYVDVVAATVASRLPRVTLVPVPRVLSRRLRYGVDPAMLLARALARRLDVEVLPALAAPIHATRRAGGDHRRPSHGFQVRRALPDQLVLVDDVVTTGATMVAAMRALGTSRVVAATAANTVSGVSSVPFS